MPEPGWTGPMDGPFRGRHLVWCRVHPRIWFPEGTRCPLCLTEERIAELEREVAALREAGDPDRRGR